MSQKISAAAILVLLAGLSLIIPVFAGGWAVVTLDNLPEEIRAGETIEISFMLRGHGVTPIKTDGLSVEAKHLENSTRISIPARSAGTEGKYLASLSFPHPGPWEWGISLGPYGVTQPMPILDVLPAALSQQAKLPDFLSVTIWMLTGLSSAAAVLLFLLRKPIRWAAALAVAGLAIGGLGFTISTAPASGTAVLGAGIAETKDESLASIGSDLFVAKGCVICHHHAGIPDSLVAFQTNLGPDLSNYSSSPAFLQLWLSDPAEVKPKTQMPNLALSQMEIEALISFLNDGS